MRTTVLLGILALAAHNLSGAGMADISNGAPAVAPKWHPGHYVFVGEKPIIADDILPHFQGVQKLYKWKLLEPEQGKYDFSLIKTDLALLKKSGKQLVIQVQYKAFGKDACSVPTYRPRP